MATGFARPGGRLVGKGAGGGLSFPALRGAVAGEGVLPGGQRCAPEGAKVCPRTGKGLLPGGQRGNASGRVPDGKRVEG